MSHSTCDDISFGDKSFQAINDTGTDNKTHNNPKKKKTNDKLNGKTFKMHFFAEGRGECNRTSKHRLAAAKPPACYTHSIPFKEGVGGEAKEEEKGGKER